MGTVASVAIVATAAIVTSVAIGAGPLNDLLLLLLLCCGLKVTPHDHPLVDDVMYG